MLSCFRAIGRFVSEANANPHSRIGCIAVAALVCCVCTTALLFERGNINVNLCCMGQTKMAQPERLLSGIMG